LYETYEDKRNVYLVFEVCSGGELFDRIINEGHFSEVAAKNLFSQITKSLLYCHKHGICHRDLKPENFLFATTEADSPLKVIDFGLSKIYKLEEEILAEKKIAPQYRGRRRKAVNMKTKAGTVRTFTHLALERICFVQHRD
jgi:calcium-dependent protein kinase